MDDIIDQLNEAFEELEALDNLSNQVPLTADLAYVMTFFDENSEAKDDIVLTEEFKDWWCNIYNDHRAEQEKLNCAGLSQIPTLEQAFDQLDANPE